jgi:hypothetical protein
MKHHRNQRLHIDVTGGSFYAHHALEIMIVDMFWEVLLPWARDINWVSLWR